jgi:hypothetical protein
MGVRGILLVTNRVLDTALQMHVWNLLHNIKLKNFIFPNEILNTLHPHNILFY